MSKVLTLVAIPAIIGFAKAAKAAFAATWAVAMAMRRISLSLALCAALCLAQTPLEISTQDESVIFQSKVTLVAIPVVVRDESGKAVGTLRREDFQLFDKGKPQAITKFSIEKSGGQRIARLSAPETELTPKEAAAKAAHPDAAPVIAPDHFVALAFEDIQSGFADLSYSRAAAQKFIPSGLTPADRVAVFTTSGQTIIDFTDDRDLLIQTLMKLKPHPMPPSPAFCPSMSYPEAYRIMDLGDEVLRHRKVLEARICTQREEGLRLW